MPLSNFSHVPSLRALILPPSNSGLIQQQILRFDCLSFLRAVVGSSFRPDSNYSPATLGCLPITESRALDRPRLRHCLTDRCSPTAQIATAMGMHSLSSRPRDQKVERTCHSKDTIRQATSSPRAWQQYPMTLLLVLLLLWRKSVRSGLGSPHVHLINLESTAI